jgi:anaerobic selenocysteine-containing dehydrogenase
MAESHFFVEVMERGAKIVTITPEYSPPATKADYWIPIRPATDTALFLGITRWLMDNEKYNADFVKRFTDFPMLVRVDTLKRLSAAMSSPTTNPASTQTAPALRSTASPRSSTRNWATMWCATPTANSKPSPATTWATC